MVVYISQTSLKSNEPKLPQLFPHKFRSKTKKVALKVNQPKLLQHNKQKQPALLLIKEITNEYYSSLKLFNQSPNSCGHKSRFKKYPKHDHKVLPRLLKMFDSKILTSSVKQQYYKRRRQNSL